MKHLGTAKKDPLTTLGKTLMLISLAITAIVLGSTLHGVLNVTGWLAWPAAIAGALAFDLVWLAGLSRLPLALKTGGTLLTVTGGVSLLGLAASVTTLYYTGHVGIFAALPGAAMFLLTVRPVLDHLTPARTTVETLAGQKQAEKDRQILQKAATRLHKAQQRREAGERALAAQKVTDELLDAHRHDVAREIAVLRGKARLVAELEAARHEFKEAADLLDSLMDAGVEPAPLDAPDRASVDGGQAHSALEEAPADVRGTAVFGFARALDDTTATPQVATSVHVGSNTGRTAGLTARNEAARMRRESAYAAIRNEGLDVNAVVARYGVTEQTARRWIKAAAAA